MSSNRELYNSTRTLRNVGSQRRLEGFAREAFSSQLLRRFRRSSKPLHERACPVSLRLEATDRRCCGLAVDPVPREIVPDRLVSVAPPGKGACSRRGEPGVIDVADPLERVESVGALAVSHTGSGEAIVELPPGTIAMLQRSRCELDRIALPPLPRH